MTDNNKSHTASRFTAGAFGSQYYVAVAEKPKGGT